MEQQATTVAMAETVMPGAREEELESRLFGPYNKHGSAIWDDDHNYQLAIVDVWRVLRVAPDGKCFWVLWRTPNFGY
jgi:hypothetical protein